MSRDCRRRENIVTTVIIVFLVIILLGIVAAFVVVPLIMLDTQKQLLDEAEKKGESSHLPADPLPTISVWEHF